ncbi:hypothetical protein Tco_1089332 [Tanacetum coccineum]
MIDCLSIVETDKVIHTVETDIVKLVVEIESFGMSSDEFDKETRSSDGLQSKQADLSCVHALNELYLHETRVVLRYKWKPTVRFFTIVGSLCPLTRITPKKIVHLKETTPKSVETPKPEIKVYSRRPKQLKSVGSSKKAKIVESKISNNSEPTHLWGSNATDVPSSSSLVNDTLSRSSSGIWTPDVQNI